MNGAPLKIVHVIPALTKGGAEKVVVDLANQGARAGHDVTVVAGFPVDPALIQHTLLPAVTLKFVAPAGLPKLRPYLTIIPWLLRNWSWLRQADIVHAHLTFASIFATAVQWTRRITGGTGPRTVETFHGVGMPIRPSQRSRAARLAQGRDGFVLMAEDAFWADFAAKHPRLPTAVIPNGIDTDMAPYDEAERIAYRRMIGMPDSARVIGTIGRLRAERNPFATVAAFAEAAKRLPDDVHFIIGGDGPMTDAVRAEGNRLGLGERLHLPGLVIDPALAIAIMDVYVSMNVGAITGIAGLEAAAAGKPVIALQARPGHIATDADWIWSSEDPAAVGAEAARLLDDPAATSALGESQRAHVTAHHSAATMARAYEAFYRRIGA
ncbi:MAG: glycosyltransferase [Pseudomonadota bacterium]|nr:glycosyltransferase [Pseudomonadota bacterium]